MLKLMPKQMDFFSIFEQTASNLQIAAKIYDAEQEGDILTHEVFKRLNKTFLTPIDREDIQCPFCKA